MVLCCLQDYEKRGEMQMKMKRFSLTGQPSRLTEVENGEWVRWEDMEKFVGQQVTVVTNEVSEKFYAVFGLTSLESNEEIKQRYRHLCKIFHPDMALSEEAKQEFIKKFNEINLAYEEIKKERGLE